MREILFKGFHECENGETVITVNGIEKRGEWVEGSLLNCSGGMNSGHYYICSTVSSVNYHQKDNSFVFGYWFEVIPETVSQFTGLVDKNGKKIFENDIVLCNRYDDENYQVVIDDIWNLPREMFGSSLNWREVIGNTFDNPELLEG